MSNVTIDLTNLNEEEIQVEGQTGGGGGFTFIPPLEGVALFRLRDVIEFGERPGEYQGKPKKNPDRPCTVTFELVHPRHAIRKKAEGDPEEGPFTGDFIRNHEVTVRLNKSNNEKSKYMKLFNALNFDGRVATPKGKIPSFAAFAGDAFYGQIHLNEVGEGDKKRVYVNLDKDGVYTIGAPRVAEIDPTLNTPTGEFKEIPVPEMQGDVRVFLWETGVNDEVYKAMWESIAIVGEKEDGTAYKNWIQDQIANRNADYPNTAWEGSRAQKLFDAAEAELAEALEEGLTGNEVPAAAGPAETQVSTAETETAQSDEEKTTENKVEDPLAGLI